MIDSGVCPSCGNVRPLIGGRLRSHTIRYKGRVVECPGTKQFPFPPADEPLAPTPAEVLVNRQEAPKTVDGGQGEELERLRLALDQARYLLLVHGVVGVDEHSESQFMEAVPELAAYLRERKEGG